MGGNKAALAFDLFSDSTRQKYLIRSLESVNLMSSSQIILIQEGKSGKGFLIFYPHYRDS